MNSDYELTKGAVESVLTGEITSHTHKSYSPFVYPSSTDLSTLTQYERNGEMVDFEIGNIIFVEDAEELTGYSMCVFGQTRDGKAWLRVPMIANGYQILLLKGQE